MSQSASNQGQPDAAATERRQNLTSLDSASPRRPGGKPAVPLLSLMMFLQYAVWGMWLPVLGRYLQAPVEDGGLGFSAGQVGWIIGTAASIGAVTGPFIAGQFADRYFRAERFLASLLLMGGVVQIILAQQTSYTAWMILAVLYSVLFMPTLSLTNSVAFANLDDSERQFPKVRVWGTLGWIAAGWGFAMLWLGTNPFLSGGEAETVTSRLIHAMTGSGILSIAYAGYCLLLPATPPKREGVERFAVGKAFALLRRPSVLVLTAAAVLIAMIHQIYFIQTGQFFTERGLPEKYIGPAMTVAQFAEIIVMAFLGLMLTRLRFRTVLAIGAFAYFIRYAIWAVPGMPISIIVASQAFHGFCYACFFAGTYIYIDRIAPRDVRHSAQTMIGIMMLGVGPVLASIVFPLILEYTGSRMDATPPLIDYTGLWGTTAAIGLLSALLIVLCFREEIEPEENPALVPEPEGV